jgi:hypothetical protein
MEDEHVGVADPMGLPHHYHYSKASVLPSTSVQSAPESKPATFPFDKDTTAGNSSLQNRSIEDIVNK